MSDLRALACVLILMVLVIGGVTAIVIPWPDGCVLVGPLGVHC